MHQVVRLCFLLVVVGWLFILPFSAAGAAQSQVTLTVQVVDQGDVPIGGADLNVTWDGGSTSASTASNGQALVDVPRGETVTIDVTHEDFVRNDPLVVEEATERDVTISVALKGHATVSVTDTDRDPLDNATVEIRRDGQTVIEGETDADGIYESGVIEQGRYDFRAVKPGYYRESDRSRVGVDSDLSFELERGDARLEITAVDDHFDPPQTLENARVRLTDYAGDVATVRADGGTAAISVEINNLYTVTVLREGYVEAETIVRVHETDRSVEAAAQRIPTLTTQPQNRQVVVGETTQFTVLNAYEEPVEGAEIHHDGESVGETDADGEVVIEIASEGEREFTAVHDDVESDPVTIEGIDPDSAGEDDAQADTTGDVAGFGVVVAIVAFVAAGLFARRR